MRVIGFAGWSGSGKTTLLKRLIPVLVARGVRVATIKHAHHDFDIDHPGKDSYEHRKAGAGEVLVSSSRRWALMHENADEIEPSLVELLGKLAPCDLVLIEGFKREPFPKIEVFRHSAGKPPLHPEDSSIIAIATDSLGPPSPVPLLDLNDAEAVAQFVLERAIAADRLIAPC